MKTALQAAGVLLLTVCASCGDRSSGAADGAVKDTVGILIVSNVFDENVPTCGVDPNPALTIGTTDGAPEYQLYRTFGAGRLSDGRIVVVNQGSQELRFYDETGTYLASAGRAGAGPGEFTDAFTMQILPGDTLWVGDYRPWEFEVFAPDGSWVRSLPPTPPQVNTDFADVLDDGRAVMVSRTYGRERVDGVDFQTRVVVLHGQDGMVIDTIGTFRAGPDPYPMFGAGGYLAVEGQRLVEGHASKPELRVYEIGDSSRLDRVIRWTADPKPVTRDHVASERTRLTESFADLDPQLRQQLLDPQIREDRPVADVFPYFSSIEIGRDGRIWLRGYRMPDETGPEEWLVFDADGTLSCRVTAEPFEQLPEFGSDYILVMRRDSLGVERIFKHDLDAPVPGAR